MSTLIKPTPSLHASFLAAHNEWSSEHQDGSGVEKARDIQDLAAFRHWIESLEPQETQALQEGYVTCSYYWLVKGTKSLGAIAPCHELIERCGGVLENVRGDTRRYWIELVRTGFSVCTD